ncbi:MAG: hypothetical protein WBC21_01100 [Minisyncoccales bacterium]
MKEKIKKIWHYVVLIVSTLIIIVQSINLLTNLIVYNWYGVLIDTVIISLFLYIIWNRFSKKRQSIKEKIKIQKGFIHIPILAVIMIGTLAIGGGGFGFLYYKNSELIKEAEQLAEEEKYNEAIEKLQLAQDSFIVEKLTLNKQKITDRTEENKKLVIDKINYNQGLDRFDKENYQEAIDLFSEIPEDSFYSNNSKLKTEEAKRKIVEEELGETKTAQKEAEEEAQQEAIKRSQAEAKAKQEEFEKKLREQELADKETEEKMMNADNDNDGLTYREEEKKGTSDWNSDSDDDGIPDGEDTNPTGGGEYKPQYFEWEYDGTAWTWTYSIHEDWYNYYNNKPRSSHGLEYVTSDDPFIQEIAKALKETAEEKDYHLASFITSFVQGLPYVADFYTNIADRPKYPVETFIDRNGDCEDFSYLSASLITATDIGVALIEFDDHMAIGIKTVPEQDGSYYEIGDGRYYYFETTAEDWRLGEMPDEYKNKQAKITRVWDGEITHSYPKYKKPCYASPDFSGYYYDSSNYYSDSQCNNLIYCMPYQEFYLNPQTSNFYWDSSCSQIVVKGCKKSKTYSGKFYISGTAWYYDSRCTNLYKSMTCDYPSSYAYSCAYESSYNLKESTCDYYKSSSYLSDLADDCYEELAQCRKDINEYQSKLDEYNQCKDRKEY